MSCFKYSKNITHDGDEQMGFFFLSFLFESQTEIGTKTDFSILWFTPKMVHSAIARAEPGQSQALP